MNDVIVVGAGVAGLTAAVRLAESGARVLVLAKGVGATHLSAGTIDVLGYAPERVASPREALGPFIAGHPEHPYARVGVEGIEAALGWFTARLPYVGSLDENLLLPTAVGVPRPSAVVPETMAAGDLRGGGDPVAVVGFRASKDFHPALMADGLTRLAGVPARALVCSALPEDRVDANGLAFARAFEDAAFRERVVTEVAGQLRAGERVAFPAVLGVTRPVWAEVAERLGRPVFEVPTLPPSVPGMRVFGALRDALRHAGGRLRLNNVVVGSERAGARVSALRVRVGLREETLRADWFVLASGGVASGGIALDSRWRVHETALGVPVHGAPDGERFSPDYFASHPMSTVGVAVDGELRPLGDGGERWADNVLVAGATLAGAVPWKEKSGDGISLATGFAAAGLVLGKPTKEVVA